MTDAEKTTRAAGGAVSRPDQPPQNISQYYLELECLLDQVERSTTYYQMLGLERSASSEEVKLAYQRAVTLLQPVYYGTIPDPHDGVSARVNRTLRKVSRAFSQLTNFGKRTEYDNSLVKKASEPLSMDIPEPLVPCQSQESAESQGCLTPDPTIEVRDHQQEHQAYAEADSHKTENRRRCERFKITMPARASGQDRVAGKWSEVCQTVDVGKMGVAVRMRYRPRHGAVIHLLLPMPTKLRSHGFADNSYGAYALVKRVGPVREGARVIGLEFLGENPPPGYLVQPWATFHVGKWSGPERRRQERVESSEPVSISYLDESLKDVSNEVAVTENISPGGARIHVKAAPAEFDLVKVSALNRQFESLAQVCNRFVGPDGFERICLQFLDKTCPV